MVLELNTGWCVNEDVGLLDNHLDARLITTIRKGPKQIIFASGEFELLQMVSKLDTGWCVDEDAGLLNNHLDARLITT